MWQHHWRLSADPFHGPGSAFVKTSGHGEALARLADAIETGQRLAVLAAGEGLGKSAVLERAVAEARHPYRRFARVCRPLDGATLFAGLAEGLGVRAATAGRPAAWKALGDALRLCRWQKLHAVLVVDDAHQLTDPADRLDLERLAHLDPGLAGRVTVVQAVRDGEGDAAAPAWRLAIGLPRLTRTETGRYVREKLGAAGRSAPAFSPGALGCVHELSGGVPRGIDRIGSLALMAGAVLGLDLVTREVVEDAAPAYAPSFPVFAA